MHTLRSRLSMIFVLLTIAVLAIAVIANRPTPQPQAQAPHFWQDPTLRTIVVGQRGQQLTPKAGVLITNLVEGTLPANVQKATVLTDSNCTPDQNGISHCLNQLDLGSTKVTVQNHHDMRNVPCLSPGETVNIIDQATFLQLPSS